MFKIKMKSNAITCVLPPFDLNPLTKMWGLVATSWVLVSSFPKYVKLAKLTMVQIVDKMKNERCFFILAFMSQSFAIGSLPTCHLLCNVCKIVLYFVEFFVGRLHWIVAKSLSLILLWWLGNMFCAIVLLVLQRQKCVGSYVSTKLNCYFKATQLSLHDIDIFYLLFKIQFQLFIFAFVVIGY